LRFALARSCAREDFSISYPSHAELQGLLRVAIKITFSSQTATEMRGIMWLGSALSLEEVLDL